MCICFMGNAVGLGAIVMILVNSDLKRDDER